jgi:hypothetical protein
MPGLDPGIHAFLYRRKDVDGRDKPGHDGVGKSEPSDDSRARHLHQV